MAAPAASDPENLTSHLVERDVCPSLPGASRSSSANNDAARPPTLVGLPPELLHIIFDFLFSRHHPDKAFLEVDHPWLSKSKRHLGRLHPLDAVLATSKVLRAEVNDWSIHFLLLYRDIAPARLPKFGQETTTSNALRGRYGLLNWADHHCIFCGKKSTRFAIMMNGFRCCGLCDKKQWPGKITKTNARDEYDLKDYHLLPDQHLESPASKKLQAQFPHGLPKIRYGTYMSSGVPATMFLRHDVEWLAEQYHPNLQAHLARRKGIKEEKARRREEKRRAAVEATKASTSGPSAGRTAENPQYIDDNE